MHREKIVEENLPLFMIIRDSLSLILIGGGIYSLKKGVDLYLNGMGLQEEQVGVLAKGGNMAINVSLNKIGAF